MKTYLTWTLVVPLLAMSVASATFGASPPKHPSDSSGLRINGVVEPGTTKEYDHPDTVVLTNGFWAKAGSDVTVRTALLFLQMSDEPHYQPPPPPRDPNDRSPPDLTIPPECPGYGHETERAPCLSGYDDNLPSVEIDIGLNARLPNPPSYYAINMIEIVEASDNPCRLIVSGNMVDPRYSKGQERRFLAQYTLDKCKSLTTWIDLKEGSFSPSKNRFIRALQVCVDPQGDDLKPFPEFVGQSGRMEIKGLKVRAGQVSSMNEHVTAVSDQVEHGFKRANCPDRGAWMGPGAGPWGGWHNWSTCPEGQLATGLTVHYAKDKSFSAMRIKCKYVRLLSGPAPVKDKYGY